MIQPVSGFSLKLTAIGRGQWQLFITKLDDSADFVRIVYGITEQAGGSERSFGAIRSYIISPTKDNKQVFVYQFDKIAMKNRRVWAAFQVVKRVKGKKGEPIGTYIALSPVQSKWLTAIGSTTNIGIEPLKVDHFQQLYGNQSLSSTETMQLLEG